MEKPIKMDDWGLITLFLETPICPGKKTWYEDLTCNISSTRRTQDSLKNAGNSRGPTTSERPVTWAPETPFLVHPYIPANKKLPGRVFKMVIFEKIMIPFTYFYKPLFWVYILNFNGVQPRLRRSHKIQSRWDEQHFLLQLDQLARQGTTIHCALATRQEATLESDAVIITWIFWKHCDLHRINYNQPILDHHFS